ncbi:hypothetical protein FDB24_14835 [Clostridium botulinum]|uniref:hypothetical protein n=1 Tax=Clostridium botulinum TaxID=1491 RepID=UPI0007744E0E|nr:hypothetical protein [Clostridium botulinum]NFL87495.1 hypothetical protein [Clostridium botulinum]NFO22507.1 hypothetical protein [Clostridium botulinum]
MEFYTIMCGNEFLNSNFMRDESKNIIEAIRFSTEEGVKEYFKGLRKNRGFRIVKVKCALEEFKED